MTETPKQGDAQETAALPAPVLLGEMTASEIRARNQEIELVLVPIGAHEQHGPALPVSTDTLSAQILCSLTSTLLRPRVAVAPAIPWGISWSHMEIGGTITLRESTFIDLVVDIAASLFSDGFRRIVFVNGHGGNTAALGIATDRAHRELGIPLVVPLYGYSLIAGAAVEVLGPEAIGHGGGDEASAVLAVRPDLVRMDLLHDPEVFPAVRQTQHLLQAAGGSMHLMQQYVSATGVTGDSRKATIEAGNAIVGRAVAQLQAIVEHLLAVDLPLPPSPLLR